MAKRRYVVEYERDPASGVWTAVIDRRQGVSCVTQGRSLVEARRRIRDALAAFLDDDNAAAAAELVDEVKGLPAVVRRALSRARDMRERAQKIQADAVKQTEAVAKQLTAAGLSTRDTAELLSVSHQRVHQVVGGRARKARQSA